MSDKKNDSSEENRKEISLKIDANILGKVKEKYMKKNPNLPEKDIKWKIVALDALGEYIASMDRTRLTSEGRLREDPQTQSIPQ